MTELNNTETKSRRVQLLIKPSIYEGLKEAAKKENTSVNNLVNDRLNSKSRAQKPVRAPKIKAYTTDEVAKILKVTRRTVYHYIKTGSLKTAKVGKYWKVTTDNLNDFIEHGTHNNIAKVKEIPPSWDQEYKNECLHFSKGLQNIRAIAYRIAEVTRLFDGHLDRPDKIDKALFDAMEENVRMACNQIEFIQEELCK